MCQISFTLSINRYLSLTTSTPKEIWRGFSETVGNLEVYLMKERNAVSQSLEENVDQGFRY